MSTKKGKNLPNVAGLILAAGTSSRAGDVNKLLFNLDGKALVTHVAQALTDSRVSSVLVVLGHEANLVETTVKDAAVAVSVNQDFQQGLSTSLVHGVSLLFEFDAVVVCLGDMPHVTTDVINVLINAMIENPHKAYFIPVHQGRRGNPVLITKSRYEDIMTLTGDQGARKLLAQQNEATLEVRVDCESVLTDYDTLAELKMLAG